jgi:hypothetical protein
MWDSKRKRKYLAVFLSVHLWGFLIFLSGVGLLMKHPQLSSGRLKLGSNTVQGLMAALLRE